MFFPDNHGFSDRDLDRLWRRSVSLLLDYCLNDGHWDFVFYPVVDFRLSLDLFLLMSNDGLVAVHLKAVVCDKLLHLCVFLAISAVDLLYFCCLISDLTLELALNVPLIGCLSIHLVIHGIDSCVG